MTSLNFLLSRAFARTLRPGDEIVHTALDHDANVSPWLEIAHDMDVTVRVARLTDDLEVDYADLERQLSDRTRVVAFPLAAELGRHGSGRPPHRRARPLRRRARLGGRGPLRAARADRRGRLGRRRPHLLAVQVLRPAHGPRVRQAGAARVVARLTRCVRPRTSPSAHRFELGTSQHELLAGFVAAVEYMDVARLGSDARTRAGARRALPGSTAGDGRPLRAAHDGRTRPDLLLQRRGPLARGRRQVPRGARGRRAGTATTTRSRR